MIGVFHSFRGCHHVCTALRANLPPSLVHLTTGLADLNAAAIMPVEFQVGEFLSCFSTLEAFRRIGWKSRHVVGGESAGLRVRAQ